MILRRIEIAVKAALVFWFITAMYLQHDIGLADNGDFVRSIEGITSGPIGIEPNWPAPNSEDWSKRFVNYWIPFWKLELSVIRPTSSAFILWLPGILLNKFLYSSSVLYLPVLSLFPKFILFAVIMFLFNWTENYSKYKKVLLVSFVAPITIILTTTDYIAHLNSFYQDSATLVFYFLIFVSILLLRQHLSFRYLVCSLIAILFLAMDRPAYIYWPLLSIPFVLYAWSYKKNIRLHTMIIAGFSLIILFTFASAFVTKTKYIEENANAFNSYFNGVLTFTEDSSAHLRDIGMEDAIKCVNTPAYSSDGLSECFLKYKNQMSFKNTVRVIIIEPVVMLKMLKYVFDNMQDVSVNYLGKYSFGNPLSKTSPRNGYYDTDMGPLNLWAKMKYNLFPRGYSLFFTLSSFAIWFIFVLRLKLNDVCQDFAFLGLLSTFACVTDMTVAILGDGRCDMGRHLYLSNLLFDIAAILFLNSVLVYCLGLFKNKKRIPYLSSRG